MAAVTVVRGVCVRLPSSFRLALEATDRWMAAVMSSFHEEYGVSYSDALEGMMATLEYPPEVQEYTLRAFKRLERYRDYIRNKDSKSCPTSPGPLPTSLAQVLQHSYLERAFQESLGRSTLYLRVCTSK